jgi:hypothetical protein
MLSRKLAYCESELSCGREISFVLVDDYPLDVSTYDQTARDPAW